MLTSQETLQNPLRLNNIKILNKQYIIGYPQILTVEYIEKFILEDNCLPLRWAIVDIKDQKLIIDATVTSEAL